MQDHLDGRISVLIQCTGSEAITLPKNLPVDLYITPCELQKTPKRIGGDLAIWVQIFAQQFAMPHLEQFNQCCVIKNIQLPPCFAAAHINVKGPQYLPGPVVATGVHIQCSAQLAHIFMQELKATAVHNAPSAAIHGGAEMSEGIGENILPQLTTQPAQVCRHRQMEIFTPGKSFYTAKHIQAPPHSYPKVTLSKEARMALKFQQTKKLRQFKDALDLAWGQINNVTTTIAATHCKSFHHPSVWNAFCWKKSQQVKKENCNGHGKEALQSLVHDYKDKYHTLTQEEQQELLQEFANQKETKVSGLCVSMQSKINNITQTLKVVENELNSLNSCTGTEVMLYMMRSTTDLPLHVITFTMPGVNHFMDSVIGINIQDFLSKMEGFAIQGIQGAASNHQKEVSKKLRKVTGESNARMQWADYFHNMVNCYQVAIKGWLEHIPFTNLSSVTNTLPDLHTLLDCWKSGDISKKHKSVETIESSDDEDTQSHGQTPDASEDVNTTPNTNSNSNMTGCTARQTPDSSEDVSTTLNANSNSNMTGCIAGQTPNGSEDVNTTLNANSNSNMSGCTASTQ
ncbi:hypothetical protein BDR06DRAFT_1007838 [Suillus hirtellus]|nr:hypothetical protein BDR06DRAFT_1007838 [Suillus hirtellus]